MTTEWIQPSTSARTSLSLKSRGYDATFASMHQMVCFMGFGEYFSLVMCAIRFFPGHLKLATRRIFFEGED
jgi:hypothetical protein